MTLEEAKDILLKLEQLVSKTNRMYKKGERMDSAPFLKLHRKRISMFDVQEEAECIFIRFISLRICYLLQSKMVILLLK